MDKMKRREFLKGISVAAVVPAAIKIAEAKTDAEPVTQKVPLPDIPTFTEAGVPGASLQTWHGVGAPSGTPKVIIDRLSAEIAKLVAAQDASEKLDAQGFVPYYNNAEQTAALLRSDVARFARIIKEANIKGE